jgi:hypothetical protein
MTKVRGSLIIAGWENCTLDWAAITSEALVREVTMTRKKRAPRLAYWLGIFYPPPPGKERPGSRSHDVAKGKGLELPAPELIWEIGTSGSSPAPEHIPKAAPVEEQRRRLPRRLRRPASRGEETGTIPVVQFQATAPPRRTTVHVVPIEGVELATPGPDSITVRHAELAVEAEAEPPAEEEAEPEPELPVVPEPESGATMATAEAEPTEI